MANAPKPVAGFTSPMLLLEPNAEDGLFALLAAKALNKPPDPAFDVSASDDDAPPRDRPPKPASVSTSADMGSSELDMDMAIGEANDELSAARLGVTVPKPV